jgi:hypothetical protein
MVVLKQNPCQYKILTSANFNTQRDEFSYIKSNSIHKTAYLFHNVPLTLQLKTKTYLWLLKKYFKKSIFNVTRQVACLHK